MARQKVSNFSAFVEAQNGAPVFVGIDVHKKDYHVAFRGGNGMSESFVTTADFKSFTRTLLDLGLNISMIAYEAGPTGFSLARELTGAGFPVTVAAPSRIPRQVTPGAKTDRLDCLKLAKLAASGMLKPIAIPTPEQEGERALSRRRSDLAESIRKVKQRIKSLLLYVGVQEPVGLTNWSNKAVAALEFLPLYPRSKLTLQSLVRELTFLKAERAVIDAALEEFSKTAEHREVMDALCSVPGVGLVVASSFRTELFSPERFSRPEEVASYLGLAPMVRQSGESASKGRLCPVGQTRLRSLLVEAVWRWKAKDPWAEALYRKLLSRCGLIAKAISALARRLAIILWRLCLEKRPYRLGQAV